MVTKTTPYAAVGLIDEPAWPDAPGPFVFLVEQSGPLERRLVEGWIARNRPDDVDPGQVHISILPTTRRKRRHRPDRKLEAFMTAGDPLLMPLRVVWLAPERDGRREVSWRDLLIPGDPRDPDPLRQEWIYRTRPDRCRIIAGQPARAAALKARWEEPDGRGQAQGVGLAEFTTRSAWLSLEVAERKLRGSRYKVPKFVREILVERPSFAAGVAKLATEANTSYEAMAARTSRYIKEIAASHSPYVIDLVTAGIRWLFEKAYVGLIYDREELEALYQMSQNAPLVFLPSHKSNFDHLILQYVLYQNGLPPNHTAGGINMNFFPVGPFLRRSGVFFIRREFKENEPYKFALRQYIDYLLEKRFPLEWFIEGGRSRTGKLRAPRFGMLAYVVESYQRGSTDDVVLIPVSLAYDQIQDVGSYAEEQSGGKKEKESFGWMLNTIRSLRRRYGAAHVRFGAPISLRAFVAELGAPPVEADDDRRSPLVPKLAFEIANRINEATPVTPVSLVTMALLEADRRSLTFDEVVESLTPFVEFVVRRNIPMTEKINLASGRIVQRALDSLVEHGVVAKFEGATETVYRIGGKQHLAAAYYRNTIIHHFLTAAIVEMALVSARSTDAPVTRELVVDAALRLRDLLKFEFFFAPSEEFIDQVYAELAIAAEDWRSLLERGEIDKLLRAFMPFKAPAVLRPFLEGYQVVADVIEADAYLGAIDSSAVADRALTLGKQYHLQGLIDHEDSVSKVIFQAAISLAENRDLFGVGPDMVERRLGYAAQLRRWNTAIDTLKSISDASSAGLI